MTLRATREQQLDGGPQRLLCWECRGEAIYSDAERYGGRCFKCYGRYLREHTPQRAVSRRDVIDALMRLQNQMAEGQADPKAWAKRLRDSERAGEHLSVRQREAWREALGHVDTAEGSAQ